MEVRYDLMNFKMLLRTPQRPLMLQSYQTPVLHQLRPW